MSGLQARASQLLLFILVAAAAAAAAAAGAAGASAAALCAPAAPSSDTQAGQHCPARTDGRSPGLTDEQSGT